MKQKIAILLIVTGMLLIGVGILIPFFFGVGSIVFRIVYSAGAVMLLAARLMDRYQGSDLRLRRLHRLETWSALFFCVAAVFLFYPPGTPLRDPIAFTLAGAIIQLYASLLISRKKK